MTLIGMLHYRKSPEKVKKAYAFAAVAKMEGVDFIYFSYNGIDFNRRKINSWQYGNGEWLQLETDFPDVVINSSSPKSAEQVMIYRRLKQDLPFTSHSVGNKLQVYKKVKTENEFADYLIPTKRIQRGKQVISYLKKHSKIVMKPMSGNKGKDIYFIEEIEEDLISILHGKELKRITIQELVDDLTGKIKNKYIMQPFIECKTKSGLAYDFRLHVLKNENKKWVIALIYPRINGDGKLISNISSGGFRGELTSFLEQEFGQESSQVDQILQTFAISFSEHLDQIYNCSFDELGIDVGIDANRKLWIYEVNWRPGSKHREFEVAKQMIPYAMSLHAN
ncbi:YheC/YheD family protein [Metabacillus bambusae]|uniref:YheC/YheD family protein n=1 Tax=Metabacillus bambusae TaxID=2795218 RepID=A0ABS3MW81_9BACI|nr:YheC/YheD family protein [Metabacillus bambusae]MBO1510273.1 YheC/YheD family protein [Metabacillus bambusae]